MADEGGMLGLLDLRWFGKDRLQDQASKVRRRNLGGPGLGLSICKILMEITGNMQAGGMPSEAGSQIRRTPSVEH